MRTIQPALAFALVLVACGPADPVVAAEPDAGPVIGPWSCATSEYYCTEYVWLERWEFLSNARSCPRWQAARCPMQGTTGLPFRGRCNFARTTRYPSPRAEVVYGDTRESTATLRERCAPGTWEESY